MANFQIASFSCIRNQQSLTHTPTVLKRSFPFPKKETSSGCCNGQCSSKLDKLWFAVISASIFSPLLRNGHSTALENRRESSLHMFPYGLQVTHLHGDTLLECKVGSEALTRREVIELITR